MAPPVRPRQRRAGPAPAVPEIRRSLEPYPSRLREPVQPTTQRPVALHIIAEAPFGDRPADFVHGACRQAFLVRVHAHREHFPLLSVSLTMRLVGGHTC